MGNILEDSFQKTEVNTEFRTKEIPDIDLYMDQIIGFINSNFSSDGDEKDKLLTKTMIHNYSKEGLIKPVKGKKYSKEHIIQMLLVYQLKNTVKIGDIKSILKEVYQWEEYDTAFLAGCFDEHMESRSKMLEDAKAMLTTLSEEEELDLHQKKDAFIMMLNAAALSYYYKCVTEKMIADLSKSE